MSDLPRGWVAATLGDVGRYLNGRGFKKTEWAKTGRPIVRIQDLTGSGKGHNYFEGDVDENHLVQDGDLLISWAATIDAFIWRGPEACVNQHIFKVDSFIDKKFHFYAVRAFANDLRRRTHGGGIVHVTRDRFDGTPLLLPPLDEQRRIVAKVEEVLSDLDAGVTALERARANLKRYRAAVLKAAVEGRLTEKWRAAHPDVEPASMLLERTLAERRKRWEEAQLKKYTDKGQSPPRGWKETYPEPIRPGVKGLPELPAGWCWTSIEQLVERSEYGTSVKCAYEAKHEPVLRIPNIADGRIDLADMKRATVPLNLNSQDALRVGDLLVCRTNGSVKLVGKAALVESDLGAMHAFASYLLRLRFVLGIEIARWVWTYLSSQPGRSFLEGHATSSAGQHNVSLSLLHGMAIPLAPPDELTVVNTKIDDLLSSREMTDHDVEGRLRHAAVLRQAILKRAFEGKLIPQDPNDEPASELLAKIRAARARERKATWRMRRI